ncbi:MAG: cytochrome c [Verrucomicrobiota bacterium]
MKTTSLLIPLLLATAFPALCGVSKIELPAETPILKQAPGAELVTSQCLICHSTEYITTQPRLPRAYWKGAIVKMQQKFGAPIPAAQVDPLIDYLVKNYGKGE